MSKLRHWFAWLMPPPDGPQPPPTKEEVARTLVLSIIGELASAADAKRRKVSWEVARDEVLARHEPAWERDQGRPVAREAWWIVETRIRPTTFLTPFGLQDAGLIPDGSVRLRKAQKPGPHWIWIVLQWIANWR